MPKAMKFDDVRDELQLEQLDANLFRGWSPPRRRAIFGGLVLGQSLHAAVRTVDPALTTHSLHCYFLRPGNAEIPTIYEVDRIRDGRSFTTRRVVAIQDGKAIFSMSASFQVSEKGFEHQEPMPDVPGPEELPSEEERRREIAEHLPEEFREWFLQEQPIDLRPLDPPNFLEGQKYEPMQRAWIRSRVQLPADDIHLHQCVLAYASDLTLLGTSSRPHGVSWLMENFQSASLDHAMWFHRPFRADEWLLYVMDSPSASNARGFNRGSIYTRDGVLVASVAQEGLIRYHDS